MTKKGGILKYFEYDLCVSFIYNRWSILLLHATRSEMCINLQSSKHTHEICMKLLSSRDHSKHIVLNMIFVCRQTKQRVRKKHIECLVASIHKSWFVSFSMQNVWIWCHQTIPGGHSSCPEKQFGIFVCIEFCFFYKKKCVFTLIIYLLKYPLSSNQNLYLFFLTSSHHMHQVQNIHKNRGRSYQVRSFTMKRKGAKAKLA